MIKVCSLLLLILILGACKKNTSSIQTCEDFTDEELSKVKTHSINNITYRGAEYNPNNSNEIIYLKTDQSRLGLNEIACIRNLKTGKETELLYGCLYPAHWSSKGWIVSSVTSNQLCAIKSNGDSLSLLDNRHSCTFPDWSPDGKQIVLLRDTLNTLFPFIYNLASEQYRIISIERSTIPCWSPDGKFIAYSTEGMRDDQPASMKLYDTAAQTTSLISITTLYNDDLGKCWTPDGKYIIWATMNGVYKIDVARKQAIEIHKSCSKKKYLFPSVSADGSTIMLTRIDYSLTNNGATYFSTSNIWLMDINGNNERQLF